MALYGAFSIADSIDEAFERCGRDPSAITGEHIASAQRSIRLLLSDWNTDSVDFWKVASGQQQALTVNQAVFTPLAGTIDIIRIACRRDVYDTPMLVIAASDWFAIPDRQVVIGMPNRLWCERLVSTVNANIYPMSENATDVLIYDALLQFNDSSFLAGSPDVPDTWLNAFVDGLTVKLAEKYAPDRLGEKQALYGGPMMRTGSYARARYGNRERGDTVLIRHSTRRPRR